MTKEEMRISAGQSSTIATSSETSIELPDGTLIPESEFGKPPADLPYDQLETWYVNRAQKLMTQGYVDNGDDQ